MAANLSELEQLVLLALLRLGPDAYGVSITRELIDQARREVSFATVYKALIRLETQRLITSRMGEPTPERGGRRKRHYTLLPAGRAALTDSLEAIRRMSRGIGRLLPDEAR